MKLSKLSIMKEHFVVPSVYISIPAMAKVRQLVAQCPTEIAWLGCVKHEENESGDQFLTIYDVHAPKQEVGPATCDIDADGVAEYAMSVDNPEDIKYWGHSHVNMGVSPSGTDDATFAEFTEHCDDMFVMSIHNKSGAIHCAVYLGNGVVATEVPMMIDYDEDSVVKSVETEISENVRKKSYVRSNTPNRYNPNNTTSASGSTHTGSGSSGQSLGNVAGKDGNARRNAMGLRQH